VAVRPWSIDFTAHIPNFRNLVTISWLSTTGNKVMYEIDYDRSVEPDASPILSLRHIEDKGREGGGDVPEHSTTRVYRIAAEKFDLVRISYTYNISPPATSRSIYKTPGRLVTHLIDVLRTINCKIISLLA